MKCERPFLLGVALNMQIYHIKYLDTKKLNTKNFKMIATIFSLLLSFFYKKIKCILKTSYNNMQRKNVIANVTSAWVSFVSKKYEVLTPQEFKNVDDCMQIDKPPNDSIAVT